MKQYPVEKKILIVGSTIFCFGLLIFYFSQPNIAIGIFGTGFASFTGALAAFSFEKKQRQKEKNKREVDKLQYIMINLASIIGENNNHIELIDSYIKSKKCKELDYTKMSTSIDLEKIAFIAEIDLKLYTLIHNVQVSVSFYESVITEYNSLIRENKTPENQHLTTIKNFKVGFDKKAYRAIESLQQVIRDRYSEEPYIKTKFKIT